MKLLTPKDFAIDYSKRLQDILIKSDWSSINLLADDMLNCWKNKRQIFFCGNGGSAGNAIHLANDFLYGVAKVTGQGMKVTALSSNPAVITCLANDVGYEYIFSEQLLVLAEKEDIVIILSGSGNSPNIIQAIKKAKEIGVKSYAIVGFTGGKCKDLADETIHFPVNDMQIAEDLQLIVGHILMQWFYENRRRNS